MHLIEDRPTRQQPAEFGNIRGLFTVVLLAMSLCMSVGCGPRVWIVMGPETGLYPPSDGPAADPLTRAADGLLAQMLEADFVTSPSDSPGPIPMAIQAFRLHDPAPPADLMPVGDMVRARLFAGLERSEQITAVRAAPIDGTPILFSEQPPRMTLALEVFRLLDVPQVPDRAFYFVRLWAFDVQKRKTVWEASSDPIAWPIPSPVDD